MDRSSISGFSILEIFITILIISISALVIAFFTKSTVMNYSSAHLTGSAYISGEEKLSELRAAPFPLSGNDIQVVENDTFTRRWTIPANVTPKTVVIDVSWSLMGRSRTIKVYGAIK